MEKRITRITITGSLVLIILVLAACTGQTTETSTAEPPTADVSTAEPTTEVLPSPTVAEPTEVVIEGDAVRGGLLYDKWWTVIDASTPETDHPLWATQSTNTRTGADTWRCKECHGWDYLGLEGAYGSGSHSTGFPGVYDTELNAAEVVSALTSGDHDFSSALSEQDMNDLAVFVTSGLIDEREFIDYETKQANGDVDHGGELYADACAACHGDDGWLIAFDDGEAGVGTLASDNPWETLHKIRFGNPGSNMPSALDSGWSIQDAVDVLAYAQTLPIAAP
jgi:thiosulfate dehydrogenase